MEGEQEKSGNEGAAQANEQVKNQGINPNIEQVAGHLNQSSF